MGSGIQGVCSRCPVGVMSTNEDGDVVRNASYVGVEYKNLPCVNCKLIHESSTLLDVDASNSFRNKVSIDSMYGSEGTDFANAEETGWGEEREDWTDMDALDNYDPKQIASFVADFLRFLIRMDIKTQRVVVYWLLGRPLRVAAGEIGQSVQGTHNVLKAAHKSFKYLRQIKSVIRGV